MKTQNIVYISLGSNSANSQGMLAKARAGVAGLRGINILSASAIYCTEPQGYKAQPWFANQVLKLSAENGWQPEYLMDALLHLETRLGRIRANSWRNGPRAIDLDILLFGDMRSESQECLLPHPRMLQRAFVLLPLLELEPELAIEGAPAGFWLNRLDWRREDDKIFQK